MLRALEADESALRAQLDLRERAGDASAAELDALRGAAERVASRQRALAPPLAGFVRAAAPEPSPDGGGGGGGATATATAAAGGAAAAAFYRDLVVDDAAPAVPEEAAGPSCRAWCDACGADYDARHRRRHESSVAHALALGFKPRSRRILLPEANVGARLLEIAGWADDGERPGLGAPGREGRVQPLPVSLKRDTAGLGARGYAARVTHFAAGDTAAVARARPPRAPPPPKTTAGEKRKRRRATDAADRKRSVALRRDFSDTVPEGYEALFR